MPIRVPQIQELSRDERLWRIDWLGATQINPNVPTEPAIEVIISPLRNELYNPSTEETVVGTDRKRVLIGVGQLPFLRIGSIWHQGRVTQNHAGEIFKLPNIAVEPSTVSLITTGHQIGQNRYAIPPYLYKVGTAGLGAKCFAISYNNDPYGIILPVAEAIRFYYAGSTDLAQIAFHGTYEHALESIINTDLSGYIQERRLCVLRLRRWLADDDAWTIARVLHSKVAYAGVKRIHDSLLIQTSNRLAAFPECHLPFHGATTWSARGLKIPLGGDKHRYLIFELLRCAAPFPFDNLEVTRDNDGRPASPHTQESISESEKKPGWAVSKKSGSDDGKEKPLQSNQEPDARFPSIEIPLPGERFDALEGKCVIRHPKEECRYKGIELGRLVSISTDSLGTGEGVHATGKVEKAEIVIKRPRSKALAASLDTLFEVIHALNSSPGIQANLFCPNDEWQLPLTQPSNRAQWSYLESDTKSRRGVLALEILHDERFSYLIEFEQRPTEHKAAGLIAVEDGTAISRQAFARVLLALSKHDGVWNENSLKKIGIVSIRLKHTWKDPTSCAQTVIERLFGLHRASSAAELTAPPLRTLSSKSSQSPWELRCLAIRNNHAIHRS